MQELSNIETDALVDMLVTYTAEYTRMLNEGGSREEFEKCKLTLKAIQVEIDFRKNTYDSATFPGSGTTLRKDLN